eukprot:4351107-Karenia_brevis.AAC.1
MTARLLRPAESVARHACAQLAVPLKCSKKKDEKGSVSPSPQKLTRSAKRRLRKQRVAGNDNAEKTSNFAVGMDIMGEPETPQLTTPAMLQGLQASLIQTFGSSMSSSSSMVPGARVKVHGLMASPELNGQTGVVQAHSSDVVQLSKERVPVVLDSTPGAKPIMVKVVNLAVQR